MTYLIYGTDDQGKPFCFYTNWFSMDNHYRPGMLVVNLRAHTWTNDGKNWRPADEDHL